MACGEREVKYQINNLIFTFEWENVLNSVIPLKRRILKKALVMFGPSYVAFLACVPHDSFWDDGVSQ